MRRGTVGVDTPFQTSDRHLLCADCNARYPITEDEIPIMWDADLRNFYAETNSSHADTCSAIDANIVIYDKISDDYNLFTRQDPKGAKRMKQAVTRILERRCGGPGPSAGGEGHARLYHLDFGCGPGHVLSWLKEFGFRQIGLDVSLKNLRNARRQTGCRVVCGNACNMPFADGSMDVVTEAAVLHHILDWKSAVAESIRICGTPGGVVIDGEPTKVQLAWSRLAIMVLNARFPVYRVLSYVMRDKYVFRDTEQAKLNLQAEVHHQPGTGIPLDEVEALFAKNGLSVEVVISPTPKLSSKANPGWKSIVMNVLSARNPWNPRYGSFIVMASRNGANAAGPTA
jgi:SAM-dependent methyltransferase